MRRPGDDVRLVFASDGGITFHLPDIYEPRDQIEGFFTLYELSRATNGEINVKHSKEMESFGNKMFPSQNQNMRVRFGQSEIEFNGKMVIDEFAPFLVKNDPECLRTGIKRASEVGRVTIKIEKVRL